MLISAHLTGHKTASACSAHQFFREKTSRDATGFSRFTYDALHRAPSPLIFSLMTYFISGNFYNKGQWKNLKMPLHIPPSLPSLHKLYIPKGQQLEESFRWSLMTSSLPLLPLQKSFHLILSALKSDYFPSSLPAHSCTEMDQKVDLFCYATARQKFFRNIGPTFLSVSVHQNSK